MQTEDTERTAVDVNTPTYKEGQLILCPKCRGSGDGNIFIWTCSKCTGYGFVRVPKI